MKKTFLFFILLTLLSRGYSQNIYGVVYDEKDQPMPYASILIKGTTKGASANNRGEFSFNLPAGTYILVCQHVGYEKQELKVVLNHKDVEVNFKLYRQQLQLKEIVVKSGDEDPAYEIIRQAIKKRDFYYNQVKAFECETYIKGQIKLRHLPRRILGQKIKDEDKRDMRLDSSNQGIIFLSESITKVAYQQPNKIKLEVVSGRQSGGEGFGFSFPTFITLYQNNVKMFTERINPRGFISPIADGALSYYRYKYLGSFWEDGKEINTIRITPKRAYEPLFSGIINITEGDWRIHSCDLLLTKQSQLEIIDTLQLTQIHVPVSKDVWRVKNQLLHFNFKQLGIDAIGNFAYVYSKYNVDPHFPKKYFDRTIMTFDTSATKKTKEYWDTIRPIPLEPEEIKDYRIKDSIYKAEKDSAFTKHTLDSLKKKQGHVTLKQIFWSGINRTHFDSSHPYNWHIEPVLKMLQYNIPEGVVVDATGSYDKYLKNWRTNLIVTPDIRYGFSNRHLNPSVDLTFRTRDLTDDKKLKREAWHFAGGKRVSQFNKESNISYLSNTMSTLLFGQNYLKIYENWFANVSYSKRFESGWRFTIDALYEDRIPLNNTADFLFFKKDSSRLTPNYPYLLIPSQFERHQAVVAHAEVSVKPGQRYIQFPKNKIAIGSKFPTFTLSYDHGFNNILGSDVDFDKWKFTIRDDKNLKLAGAIKYKVSVAGFLNTHKLYIQDYQFFNGNQSILAKEYLNTFQLLPYYSAATTASLYGIVNFEHHLNGLLTNKLPLFKKLNWNLVDGVNAFYVNKDSHYTELFIGLENIFKVARVDFVAGFLNNQKAVFDVRIGFGGIIGGAMSNRTRSR
jgi:hypothetical protein